MPGADKKFSQQSVTERDNRLLNVFQDALDEFFPVIRSNLTENSKKQVEVRALKRIELRVFINESGTLFSFLSQPIPRCHSRSKTFLLVGELLPLSVRRPFIRDVVIQQRWTSFFLLQHLSKFLECLSQFHVSLLFCP